jgi:hypothetical protein
LDGQAIDSVNIQEEAIITQITNILLRLVLLALINRLIFTGNAFLP